MKLHVSYYRCKLWVNCILAVGFQKKTSVSGNNYTHTSITHKHNTCMRAKHTSITLSELLRMDLEQYLITTFKCKSEGFVSSILLLICECDVALKQYCNSMYMLKDYSWLWITYQYIITSHGSNQIRSIISSGLVSWTWSVLHTHMTLTVYRHFYHTKTGTCTYYYCNHHTIIW